MVSEQSILESLALIFGEIIPKVIAIRNSIPFASFVAIPLQFVLILFKPFIFLLRLPQKKYLIEDLVIKRVRIIINQNYFDIINVLQLSLAQTLTQKMKRYISLKEMSI